MVGMKTQPFRAVLGAVFLVLATVGRGQAPPYYSITNLDSSGGHLNVLSQGGLNNLGQVAGIWTPNDGSPTGVMLGGSGQSTPYLYDPTAGGKVTLPGIIPSSTISPGTHDPIGYGAGLNNLGQFVYSESPGGTMQLDTKTGQVTSLTGSPGLITDSGQVIATQEVAPVSGWGNFHVSSYQNGTLPAPLAPVFPEMPTPEPSTIVVFAFVAGVLACRAVRATRKEGPAGGWVATR